MERKIRVLLVDDHSILREGLCALLNAQPDLLVVGEAKDGQEAIAKCLACRPDIVVMDISMEGMDGIQATRELTQKQPETRVVILTQHDEPTFVDALIDAGASAYVLKREGGASLIEAIRAVYRQGEYLSSSLVRPLLYYGRRRERENTCLTPREKEVLILIAQGLSSQEIAARLFLSAKTVSVHRSNIMRKLGLHKNTELVRYALRQGLVPL